MQFYMQIRAYKRKIKVINRRVKVGWREKLTKNFMASDGFSCVLCEQTLCLQGATRYAFIAGPCPSPRPTLRAAGGGTTLHVTRTPFTNHATDTLSGPLVRCPPNRDVTPCHASDIFDINDGNTLDAHSNAEDHEMWTIQERRHCSINLIRCSNR